MNLKEKQLNQEIKNLIFKFLIYNCKKCNKKIYYNNINFCEICMINKLIINEIYCNKCKHKDLFERGYFILLCRKCCNTPSFYS